MIDVAAFAFEFIASMFVVSATELEAKAETPSPRPALRLVAGVEPPSPPPPSNVVRVRFGGHRDDSNPRGAA